MNDIPFLYGELNKKVTPIEQSFVNRDDLVDFPEIGDVNKLYLSKHSRALYYWDSNLCQYLPVESGNIIAAVLSVNGKVGNVELNSQDVGAIPDTTTIPSTTKQLINDSNFIDESFARANFDSIGSAESSTFNHNVNDLAHNDIRLRVESIANQLNNFLNVNDESADQLSEVLALINDNKDIIDEITKNKVNVSDIQDNLDTPISNKPLSANQGVVLAKMINTLKNYIDSELLNYTQQSNLFNYIYPVGSIYISFMDVAPSEIFGGVWERIKDRFLLASGDIYAPLSTGGEATHTLTIQEMPSHAHVVGTTESDEGNYIKQWDAVGAKSQVNSEPVKYYGAATQPTGSSLPHNNMPPYSAVYIWKRIS